MCLWLLSHRINMYSEGLMDLMEMIMILPFSSDVQPKLDNIKTKAKERYLPVFEKVTPRLLYVWIEMALDMTHPASGLYSAMTQWDLSRLWQISQALAGPIYLVGGKLSVADVQLLECTLMLEEKHPGILADFPNIKVNVTLCLKLHIQIDDKTFCCSCSVSAITWCFELVSVSLQSFQGRMTRNDAVSKFLQPDSKRKPQPDENYVKTIFEVLNLQGKIL